MRKSQEEVREARACRGDTHVHERTHVTGQEQDGNFNRLWREGGGMQTVRQMGVQGARHTDTSTTCLPPPSSQRLGVKCRET